MPSPGSVTKHKRPFPASVVVTFTCHSKSLRAALDLRRPAPGERWCVAKGYLLAVCHLELSKRGSS